MRRVPSAPLPSVNPLDSWLRARRSGLRATWLGHSTVLIEIDGWRVLTDPVWGPRASPSRFLGPKRFQPGPDRAARASAARCGRPLTRSLRSSRLHDHATDAQIHRAHRHVAGCRRAPGVVRHRAAAHRRARLVGIASGARHRPHAHGRAIATFLRPRPQGRQQDLVVVVRHPVARAIAYFSVATPARPPNTARSARASGRSTW